MRLRFHWMLQKGGEGASEAARFGSRSAMTELPVAGLPDVARRAEFCRQAEECGIDSVLMAFGYYEPDTLLLAAALGRETTRLRFIVAYRTGLLAPTTFVQQVNTLAHLIGGRVSLNIVAGTSESEQRYYGDFLSHDERYQRAEEFLAVCHAFWNGGAEVDFAGRYFRVEGGRLNTRFVSPDGRTRPEIYVGGHSQGARDLAATHADCWLRMADAPDRLRDDVAPLLARGREVGLRLGVVVRPSREEAVAAAEALIADRHLQENERAFVGRSDSTSIRNGLAQADRVDWLTDCLWTGAVPYFGAPSLALVGTPDQVAAAFLDFRRAGASQFILHGWPKGEEMLRFGAEVLPRIRALEAAEA